MLQGNRKCIKKEYEYGGIEYYNVYSKYEEFITGYESYDDFMNQNSERVYVVFTPEQIKFIANEDLGNWK